MVRVGETAPEFTLPKAGGEAYNDIEEFTLSEAIGDGPIVLAFYPAAFTSGCTEEMCTFRDSMAVFEDVDADVYGVSVDLPFSQNVWITEHDLGIPMLSDWEHEVIHRYDVVAEDVYGMLETAERAVFVIDEGGEVIYAWVREDGNPDFGDLVEEIREAIEARAGGA